MLHASQVFMNAPRWIARIEPRPESLGDRLKALREAHGLRQAEVGQRLGWDQSYVSRYEKNVIPPDDYLAAAETLFGLPEQSLREIAVREELRRRSRQQPDVPGPAIAIPDEPGMYEVIEEVIAFDDLQDAKRALRLFRTNPALRDQFARFVDEALAEIDNPELVAAQLAASADEINDTIAQVDASPHCAPANVRPCR